ncbi:type II secretion system protein GspG [bacterium]|nr:type II secretion system protein GspG [bacterium]
MKRKKQHKKRYNKGFTLVEIMIVLALVVMLGSFAGVKLIDQFKRAKVDATKVQIASFKQVLDAYFLAHNTYPETNQGLEALISKPTSGKVPENYPEGGYLGKKAIPKDPFGSDYHYECEDGQTYSITSDGPDRKPGTADDIKSD